MAATTNRELKRLPTGQAKEGGTGACATICTYVASYFCALKSNSPPLDDVVVSLIVRGSIRWKALINRFTTIAQAFSLSLMTKMCVRFEQIHNPTSFEGRHTINLPHSLACGFRCFSKPVAIFLCSQLYTYVFLIRDSGREIYFFDPHGMNAVFDRVSGIDEMLRIIETHCSITGPANYDMSWAQRSDRMDEK